MWVGNCFDHSQMDFRNYAKSDNESWILKPSAIGWSVSDNTAKRQSYLGKLMQEQVLRMDHDHSQAH